MLARGEVVSDPAYGGITEPVVRRGDLVLKGERYIDGPSPWR